MNVVAFFRITSHRLVHFFSFCTRLNQEWMGRVWESLQKYECKNKQGNLIQKTAPIFFHGSPGSVVFGVIFLT